MVQKFSLAELNWKSELLFGLFCFLHKYQQAGISFLSIGGRLNWFLLCPPKGQTLIGDAPLTKAKNTTGCLRQPRLKLSECLVLWPLLLKEVLHFFVTPVLPFALNNMAQDRVVVEMLQNFWACWDLWKSAEKSCNGLGRRWIPLPPWATCKGDNGASLLLDIILDVFNPLVTRVTNIVPYGPMTYFLSKQCSFNITDSILH